MNRYITLLLILLSILGCEARDHQDVKKGPVQKVYRYPLRDEIKTLDPAHTQDIPGAIVIPQIFDGLVQYDKDLNIIPAIAERWEVSRDGLVYRFYLRKGVKFHNRREVKADDFVYSLQRLARVERRPLPIIIIDKILGAREFAEGRSNTVEGLRAVDDYTLEIRLKEPYSPLLSSLAMASARVVPKEEVEKGDFGRRPVGTGSFRFAGWKGNEIILEANPDYLEGRTSLDRLIYKVFPGPDDEGIYRAFLRGELENSVIPSPQSSPQWGEGKGEGGYQTIRRPIMNLHIYGFNNRIKPLDNKKVRQAINYAIDRERVFLKEVKMPSLSVAHGLVPPGMVGYSPEIKGYGYNPERAKELLKEAGYPGGKGLPTIEFWTASRTRAAQRELEIIGSNLRDVGIKVEVKYAPWPEMERMMRDGRLAIFRFAYYIETPDLEGLFGFLFDSRGVSNYFSYKNSEVDRLLDDARGEMDIVKRAEIYRRVEKIVLEDAPLVCVAFYNYEQLFQPYVKGIEVSPLGEYYIPMKKVWFE